MGDIVINKNIFRAYDIRGEYPNDLNKDIANIIGKSFGTYVKTLGKTTCIVGRDNRYSSLELQDSLIEGIISTGINVIDLGLVTTPMYYYACIVKNIPTGIMVTASHNPKDDNGFKFSFDERGNARGEMIEDFRDFTLKGEFTTGIGTLTKYDIREEYINFLLSSINLGDKQIKVVLDLGNGTTTCIAKDIYYRLPLDIEVIYGDSDSNFPNHHPDPSVEENLASLKRKVLELEADLGIAFDGDGDRIGLVDEKGNYLSIDKYMIIIIRDIINKVNNKTFLYDVKCSKNLEDEIKRLGGTPICYRTGNSYIKARIKEESIPFGGELSGHVYFNDRFPGFDSGLYAGLRLIEILSKTSKNLSELIEDIDFYEVTPTIKIKSNDNKKFEVIDKVKQYCINKGYNISTIDGVKVNFNDGWALIRCSNTEPNITVRFEAINKERLKELEEEFITLIKKYNDETTL